ncbi:pB175L [African swine fever virus]|uniref:Uncharacterized protein B175L n=1 Tax=African swine fever virus TaxID=10497 RepID=A0A0C5AWS4_ASF|nr:BA71V-B175L [African swine fever virus]UYB79240.1 pB175L [Recombinant African swine fever virus]AJL34264.1 BA71V-B175L [African swine fever virus]AXB49314.1 pB175L [African swine fever virus]AXB49488.1 pB175L [African swine fever virus]AXB49660.1 pB175L [African swine fever virus]
METNCPNILYLSGITIEECLQSKKNTTDALNTNGDEAEVEKKLPSVFTSVSKWVTHSSFKCWTCHLYFKTVPKFVPTYMRENERGEIEMGVLGNFCSFSCAASYIDLHYTEPKRWEARELLNMLYRFFTSQWISYIRPALSYTMRKEYGGKLSEEAFVSELHTLEESISSKDIFI